MKKISNAMLDEAEFVLKDRWRYGPLELVVLRCDHEAMAAFGLSHPRLSFDMAVATKPWSQHIEVREERNAILHARLRSLGLSLKEPSSASFVGLT